MEDWTDDELREEHRRMCARMIDRYPYMFLPTTYRADFFIYNPAIGEGWIPIFERLCEAIYRELTPEERITFRWQQVKEKFGGLRAHFSVGIPDEDLKPGFVRSAREIDVIQRIRSLIEVAQREADNTCEKCGESPASIDSTGNYLQTLCVQCAAERRRRFEHGNP